MTTILAIAKLFFQNRKYLYSKQLNMNINNEIWKDIIGYEGIYQISNKGNVKSLKRIVKQDTGYGKKYKRILKEKILKANLDTNGYLYVNLTLNKIKKPYRIHHLVADNFLPIKRNGMKLVVDHIDRNKTNNNVENLRIVTQSVNIRNSDRCDNAKCRNKIFKSKGYYYNTKMNKFVVQFKHKKIRYYLGAFDYEEDAAQAYIMKKFELTEK